MRRRKGVPKVRSLEELRAVRISYLIINSVQRLRSTICLHLKSPLRKRGVKRAPHDQITQWFLIVPEGRNVQIDFDILELEDREDCKNDYVQFRKASIMVADPKTIHGHLGPILTGSLFGNIKPNLILSQGNIVWVQFTSDRNSTTVYKGLKAFLKQVCYNNKVC